MNLYKYQRISLDSLSSLSNCCLWFSGFDKLNDPFEGTYELTAQMIFGETNNVNKVNGTISAIVNDSGVCCFSKINPIDQFNFKESTLMWSHYAEQFSGICINFDHDKLLQSLNENRESRIIHKDVIYTSLAHTVNTFNEAKDEDIMFKKHDAWWYEKEYRMVNTQSGKNKLLKYSPMAIQDIYVGGRVSHSSLNLVKIIRDSIRKDIPIINVSVSNSGYKYDIHDFDEN
ncbi:hypothetical protein WM91_18980 [Klebsiella pneumoniae]|uniref:DUF2971 domain-containing protein n=1 Tax=Klebsiella pneumoniae TaxID=573 RepID=UPI0007EA7A53|nr:DUF2971 domain-containing protein [Klebsiella pneumoniae]ANK42997.1 hypothetical protein WM91_18980 [Klebsiella pneumoniae]